MTTDPLDQEADWACLNCRTQTPAAEVRSLIRRLEESAERLSDDYGDKEALERQLEESGKWLHQNHYIMVDLKFSLVQVRTSI